MRKVLIWLVVSSVESARVTVEEHDHASWGRSCEALEERFRQQEANLAGREGARALVGSISLMRTLRRANARTCPWMEHVDTSALMRVAHTYLKDSPCYDESQAAMQLAQNLPDDEKESAMLDAMVMLFSEGEGCSTEVAEAPELGESEDELEEEMDDTTDEVMEELAQESSESSLIQKQGDPGLVLGGSVIGWAFSAIGGPLVFLGTVVLAIAIGLLCGFLMHLLVRVFRYIRCKIFGGSCSEYAPATWLKALVKVGCALTGIIAGPWANFGLGGLDSTFERVGR